ncbi:MAG: right-handed parallel beta-helix repeat-containing protein [Planctomycetota bacterium]
MKACLALCLLALCAAARAQEEKETFGCEANPTGDPIGGGPGYRDVKTTGDFIVKTKAELLDALKKAQAGQVVFVPDGVEIDLTGEKNIVIPGGATLAGTRGLNGSLGARIFTNVKESYTLMRTGGYDVRVTGLRFEGPYGGTDRVGFDTQFLSIVQSNALVDNCEIYNFNTVGVGVASGAIRVQIHHNHIHHCTKGGLGYGVSTSSSDVHIIANRFNECRHHIASSGSPGSGYEAAWNFVGPDAISHHFDMHGGRDRGDSTDIAGDWMHVHHNTFQGKQRHVVIRGVPCQGAEVHHNWFSEPAEKKVVSGGNTKVYRNVYGPDKKLEE